MEVKLVVKLDGNVHYTGTIGGFTFHKPCEEYDPIIEKMLYSKDGKAEGTFKSGMKVSMEIVLPDD